MVQVLSSLGLAVLLLLLLLAVAPVAAIVQLNHDVTVAHPVLLLPGPGRQHCCQPHRDQTEMPDTWGAL